MSKPISSIIAICLLAFTSLSQTSEKPRFFCSYGEGNRGAELCARIQMESFASNAHAEGAVDRILKPLGLRRNFVLISCPSINNAVAVTYNDGIRYIVYDNAFMQRVSRSSNTDWASLSILAHELGHHLQGHTLRRVSLQQRRMNELEADEFSGFVMFKLGASLAQAQAATNTLRDVGDEESSTHPKKWRRLEAIKAGYDNARSQQPIENIDSRPSAETFFSKALALHNQKNYREAFNNYTRAISLNPNYSYAYNNRGNVRQEGFQDYRGAIEDYNQSIRLDPSNADAYNNRGNARYNLQDYRGAIEDYNQAIRLRPNYAEAYNNRGNSRQIGFQDYRRAIDDFNQAIRLNLNYPDPYHNRAIVKMQGFQDYRGAIEDYNQAIRLNPNYDNAYNSRGAAKLYLGDRVGACEDFRRACSAGVNGACNNASQVCNYR